jgi:hypothetical protein
MGHRRSARTILAAAVLLSALVPAGTALAGKLTKHRFSEDFTELEPRFWSVDKFGGPLVGTALNRLEILLPPDSAGNPFWGSAVSRSGFFIKPDSYFGVDVGYSLPRWPTPNNGVRAALGVDLYNKAGKKVISLVAGRASDKDIGGEVYFVYLNGKYFYKKTSDKRGKLLISRSITGFSVWAGSLKKEYLPEVQYIGKASWALSAWGHDWNFGRQAVKAAFDDFRIESEKGFIVPP